jgi:hypothetical protein
LPASVFDTRRRFLDTLRQKFGEGIFNFNKGITADDLAEYCSFLKEDFQSHGNGRRQQRVYFTFHMGFQDQKYWILSKQVKFHILVYILKAT